MLKSAVVVQGPEFEDGLGALEATATAGDHRAHLLWRVSANRVLPVQDRLPDGSWLSRLHAGTDGKKRDPVRVRELAYQLCGGGAGSQDTHYRLVTDH
ncbi:hypothetical protein [Streptomyces sp. R35]|uniref:Uncharacterized protein n=1 Tax=Streptomyces sp. R35 TaxID=3238630 RepID=A0AB39SLL6_9ACTN